MKTTAKVMFASLLLSGAAVHAQQIKRTPIPNSNFPISVAVTVPAKAETIYFSGVLPDVADAAAPKGTPAAYGSTETQTASVLRKLQAALAAEGLTFGDVVSLRVFLVGDPKLDNKLDFNGLNTAFGQFFGTAAQPAKPARTALQVAALPLPGALVEIDLVAARVKP
ncbi:Enamine deaminase RidA, house cleaning of reactive enamine intermediates, YjgF/YER057c/UK114 family [Duganella sp. CF517]|uniref:RidA family protein n=1 Tax=Duganella sp. CF517 TaxID=1881038 RepID=UPI0008CB7854|nr:RidA family protein [Duganella sp. CF517]SEN18649.1 Enamine deaminase RidA, house cleaning of reactive enamine intermediates, YjgF/YER057c/UK114 family [Duganella sp. CF517]